MIVSEFHRLTALKRVPKTPFESFFLLQNSYTSQKAKELTVFHHYLIGERSHPATLHKWSRKKQYY
jgi:hypothetical protein